MCNTKSTRKVNECNKNGGESENKTVKVSGDGTIKK